MGVTRAVSTRWPWGDTKGVFIETAKADFNQLFAALVGDR
jgi:hypothetical protein